VWSNARMMSLGKLRLKTGKPWTRAELDADLAGPQGEQLIARLRQVIGYFQPQWHWIENPWLSRMRDYITDLPHVAVRGLLPVWLDWATIRFRFLRPNSGYTGSFCVCGPALSSPAHGLPSIAMDLIEIEIF
jgi:hypothetical protein